MEDNPPLCFVIGYHLPQQALSSSIHSALHRVVPETEKCLYITEASLKPSVNRPALLACNGQLLAWQGSKLGSQT